MRIRALRVREFNCFEGAVAVEGLSGRLDVLVGPNERGKSTLFRALETVFALKHSATGRQIDALRPLAGGDPMVEVDFELDMRPWRIAKRYGRSRMAELTDLSTGRTVARNGDADDRLTDLLSGADDVKAFGPRRGLLWVGQRQGLVPEKLKGEQDTLITQFIAREVEAAGGGRRARDALRQVEADLDLLVSKVHGKPKAGGRLADAIAWRERARGLKAQAEAAAFSAQKATAQLDQLAARLAGLEAPGRRQGLETLIGELRRQHEAGQAARQGLATKEAEVQAATLARNKAAEDRARFDSALAQLENLTTQKADIRLRLATAREEAARLADEVATARRRMEEAAAVEQRLRRHAEVVQAQAARAELVKRIERARAIADRHAEARIRRDEIHVTPEILKAIEREVRELDAVEARLAAGAPRIRISYAAGATGRIRLDGRPLADGEAFGLDGPIRLEIEGIGSVEIAPSDENGDSASDLDDMARHRTVLQDLLGRCGIPDVATARADGERRVGLDQMVGTLEAELGVVAPQGVAALERELERMAIQPPPQAETLDPDALASGLTAAERDSSEARRALAALEHRSADLQRRLAADDARLGSIQEQFAALEAGLPPADARQRERAAHAVRLAEAERVLDRAIGERAALERQAPSLAELSRLLTDLEKATQALATHDRAIQDTRLDVARVEAEIATLADRGEAARLQEVTEELAAAEATVTRLEDEVAALRLLAATIGDVLSETRERFLAPVVRRIEPALSRLLPGTRLMLGPTLEPEILERGPGRSEAIDVLSSGTQEQIAILVRLALADLLADQGASTPVVLDDALVYADDERIEAMFREVERASEKHQVIVLTCRARTFERLGGARLAIGAWS